MQTKFKLSRLGDETHKRALQSNLSLYADKILPKLTRHPLELAGQPLDRFYLNESKLFRRSREWYGKIGGEFKAALVSSERSLSSEGLLRPLIEYTPHEAELIFRAREKDSNIATFIQFSVSTYHEQNHRIFWETLPAPLIATPDSIRRYLNLMESLVVMLDMVLGDEVGTIASAPGYQVGVIYDPGTDVKFKDLREQKNYYHCACQATFLALERYNPKKIRAFLNQKHAGLQEALRERAIERSLKLDWLFVELTNPTWQDKHAASLKKFFSSYPKARKTLQMSEDPGEFFGEYVLIEQVLNLFLVRETRKLPMA